MQNNYFGGYLTKTFGDIWQSDEQFLEDWRALPVFNGIMADEDNSIKKIFFLLYARYGNSHIVNNDETQFKLRLWSTIFQYAPSWEKKLEYQAKIRGLTDDDILIGATNVYNHAYNPNQAPSTQYLEEVPYINDQNVTKYKKSKLEAYFQASQYLEQDFTKDFLDKFKNLFIKIVEPAEPLIYENDIYEGE